MSQILFPYGSLAGMTVLRDLERAHRLGFQGVEILITPAAMSHRKEARALAGRLGLTIHYRQAWSRAEDSTHPLNVVADLFSALPRDGYRLDEHIPNDLEEPVMVRADRWQEAVGHPNYWLGAYGMPWDAFLDLLELVRNFSVVFNTRLYLKRKLGVREIEDLPRNPTVLLAHLAEGWKQLRHLVREIHLGDCTPGRGRLMGRNVFPGTGIIPLQAFCDLVRRSGWEGTIVPEVDPFSMGIDDASIIQLRQKVEDLMAGKG